MAAVEGGRFAHRQERASVSAARTPPRPYRGPRRALSVVCGDASGRPQAARSRGLDRGGRGGAAGDLPARFPQLRHDLRARLGARAGARNRARLRRRAAPDPPPPRRPPRPDHHPAGAGCDHRDDGDRLRRAGADRLPRLPPRRALVRPGDRLPRGADRPHPGTLPLQRHPRLRRPPLHRALPRRAGDREQAAAGRLAGAGAAGGGRAAAAGGLALLGRLLRLARPGGGARAAAAPACPRRARRGRAGLAGGAGGLGTAGLGAVRPDHRRQPHLLLHRDARHGGDPGAPDGGRRPRSLRAAPPRRGVAVAGDDRRRRGDRPLPGAAAAPGGDRSGRGPPRPRCLRGAGLRGAGDHPPLHDAGRRGPRRLCRRRTARLAAARARGGLAAGLAGLRRPGRPDVRRLGAEPVRPAEDGPHRPRQPGPDRARPRRPGGLRRVRAALPADLGPQPPGGAAPRLRSGRPPLPHRQLQRAAPAAPRLLPRPGRPLRDPQLHPRSERHQPVQLEGAAGVRPGRRPQPLLEALSPLRSRITSRLSTRRC